MAVLITGGAQGIGYAAAEGFVAEGWNVCLFDLKGAAEAAGNLPGKAIGIDGDVTSEADIDAAVARCVSELDGLNCVVTSAGIVKVEDALEVTAQDFSRTMAINVTGSFLAAQRAARHMVDNGGGSVVLVGSVYGDGGAPQRTSYCASKGAVHNMTRSLAVEWGPLGVRVNAVAPTGVRTPMVQDLIDRNIYDMDGVRNRTPLGRIAEPEEIASAITYLASPAASMINGAILPVDGGWTANGYTFG